MGARSRFWWIVFACLPLLFMTGGVSAETWKLELAKRSSQPSGRSQISGEALVASMTSPQRIYMQVGGSRQLGFGGDNRAEFAKVISKEPDKYESAHPFRGVLELGGQKVGFVLDAKSVAGTAAEKKDQPNTPALPAAPRYQRLFLDANHNGDVMDDPVIEAPDRVDSPPIFANFRSASYQFPQIDLAIDVEGTTMNYSFTLDVSSMAQPEYQYAYVSLSSAVYRHGEITLDGKTKRVLLVDNNSNGRFNDQPSGTDVQYADGSLYLAPGDMLYLDLKTEQRAAGLARYGSDLTSNDEQHPVSKHLFVDGRLYDLKISAAGDTLTLEPSAVPVGFVTNPNAGFRAVVYGERGVMKIAGGDAQQSPLPAGQWRLASYSIRQTVAPAKPETAGDEKPSLMERITGALAGRVAEPVSNYSLVSAGGKVETPAIEVRAGETTVLPSGPPYKPVVTVLPAGIGETVYLEMRLVGAAGEACSNLIVNGRRPPGPKFKISKLDGTEVDSGTFEYG